MPENKAAAKTEETSTKTSVKEMLKAAAPIVITSVVVNVALYAIARKLNNSSNTES